MAVRNQHVRQSKRYVSKEIDGKQYSFYPYDWHSDKSKCRYAANKLATGKLTVPADAEVNYGTTLVFVKADGTLSGTEG